MRYDAGGSQPAYAVDQSNPFPYVFFWKHEREGQRCQILDIGKRTVRIRFVDGSLMVVNRAAIRRGKPMTPEELSAKAHETPQHQPKPDPPDKKDEDDDQDQEQPKDPGNKAPHGGQTH